MERPSNAVVLFDGTDLSGWRRKGSGEPADWPVADGAMTVGKGDIVSVETFQDAFIHLEFRTPDMPEATGQQKGNSGVYLQGKYEIQVLDSYGWERPGTGDCGAIYLQYAPLVNACKPALEWQTYDIIFRAPRLNESGEVVEQPRITLLHNGLVVHNNIILHGPTGGAMEGPLDEPGPLRLQDHGDQVQYRNIWLVHLPQEGSSAYEPS